MAFLAEEQRAERCVDRHVPDRPASIRVRKDGRDLRIRQRQYCLGCGVCAGVAWPCLQRQVADELLRLREAWRRERAKRGAGVYGQVQPQGGAPAPVAGKPGGYRQGVGRITGDKGVHGN